ncbi:MAG TPA: hypothetical protein VFC51_06490 [Chloroflexota bacterium]|nr:hypothetical protein [Chloroflexota bacterium]
MIAELLIGILRLAHAITAATWVGGTLTYALVRSSVAPPDSAAWRGFREILRAGIGVFVVTGVVLSVERLSSAALPPIYVALLAVKVALAIWMFREARRLGAGTQPARPWWRGPEGRVLALGLAIYGLAVALKSVYEETIR